MNESNPLNETNRRDFIKSSATLAGALSIPSFAIGQAGESANSKINVAVVGCAGMGNYALEEALKQNLVALCDVDERRAARAFADNPGVPKFKDFRVMLDRMGNEIDAVAISTPDHTHFAATMAAMELGKHVFVQKPLAHNIWQVRTLRKAAKHYNVISQMGNQGHTFAGMRRIKEWVDAGIVGDVTEVITWTNRPDPHWFRIPESFPPPASPVPDTLDWDLWQGPVADREFSEAYVPETWRGWWDYGCGPLGDIGCHTFDAPLYSLDLGLPTKVEVVRKTPPGEGFISMGSVVTYHFPAHGEKPPVTLKWYETGFDVPKPKRWDVGLDLNEEGGMYMEGTKNTLYHGGMRPTSPRITPEEKRREIGPQLSEIPQLPEVGDGPIDEWFRGIKGDGPMPGSNFEYAAPLTEMVLIGVLAQRTGRTIEWDAENMTVKGQPELDVLIKEPAREGWSYGENLG